MKVQRRHRDEEHRLQSACFRWFSLQHPDLYGRLFACPNGGRRDAVTGARLRDEGVIPGVADLLLLLPANGYHALCVEMKTPTGKLSAAQQRWRDTVACEYRYIVCRSLEEFIEIVNKYVADYRTNNNRP